MLLPKSISLSKDYTVEEVLETLQNEAQIPTPYAYKGLIGGRVIYVPGAGDNDIQISVRKQKMTICDAARPKDAVKSVARDIAIDVLTDGLAPFFSRGNNKELFQQVLAECKRLFES